MTHPQLVSKLVKTGEDILKSLTPEKCHLWHMASCIPSEAGELFDAIKKWAIYGKMPDRINVVEELGDLEFYMEGLREAMGITREETLHANIKKLSARYPELCYTDTAAQTRADKHQYVKILSCEHSWVHSGTIGKVVRETEDSLVVDVEVDNPNGKQREIICVCVEKSNAQYV